MRALWTISLLAAATLLVTSCFGGASADPEFLASEGFSLQVGGAETFQWESRTCQTSFNRERKEFRAFTDTMSDYWCITMSEIPTEGSKSINATLTWTTSSDVSSKGGLVFKVVKSDGKGRFWLWCKKEKAGVTVMIYD